MESVAQQFKSSRVIQNMERKKRALSLLSYNMAMDGHCDRTRSVDRASPTTPFLTPHPSPSLLNIQRPKLEL